MKSKANIFKILGLFLFSLGIAIGVVILAVIVWGNIEAFGFYPSFNSEAALHTLSCPIVITSNETGIISVVIDNPLDHQIKPSVKSIISKGFISYSEEDSRILEIAPDESVTIEWPINAKDAVYQKFIMARVIVNHSIPLEDAESVCSIFILDIPFMNGATILIILSVLYLVFTVSGYFLWRSNMHTSLAASKHTQRALHLLFAATTIGLIAVPFRMWAISAIAFISVILMAVSSLTLIFYVSNSHGSDLSSNNPM
ncbi:MAG: hypothetical protein K8R40_03930 [Anaerolineaceae bacterium]|nr:hypothetical protein [Anaerolineaceae bacterium]